MNWGEGGHTLTEEAHDVFTVILRVLHARAHGCALLAQDAGAVLREEPVEVTETHERVGGNVSDHLEDWARDVVPGGAEQRGGTRGLEAHILAKMVTQR